MSLKILAVASLAAVSVLGAEAAQKGKKVAKTNDPALTQATLHTDLGDITIRLLPDKAPHHAQNFLDLASHGVYDGVLFHRVIPGFMIQTGDPLTKNPKTPRELAGTGAYTVAPGHHPEQEGFVFNTIRVQDASGAPKTETIRNVKAEFNDVLHKRGIVSMARGTDPNSASSQFFIVVKDSTFLDHQYTAFGEVVSGMDVADKIAAAPRDSRDNPNAPVRIKKVTLSHSS